MLKCPHCAHSIVLNELPHPSLFANYRVCPSCQELFTIDKDTKYRQVFSLVVALVSLIFTLLLYFEGNEWLIQAIISYIILGLIVYRGNKQLYLVPYQKQE